MSNDQKGKNFMYYVGLDIGSVSAKLVLLDESEQIIEHKYVRTTGQPITTARKLISELLSRYPKEKIKGIALTGNGGKLLGGILDIDSVNEIVAQSTGTMKFHPQVRTIIEMGGEDSKMIKMEFHKGSPEPRISDFAMNTVCAAGTGSFLDQQAARLGLDIEGEFGKLACKSKNPPRVAGRCSVFAKTDMIHLQQEATPDYDIVSGLCHALAHNFHGNICRGKEFTKPIAFQGGVAANAGMVKAFENILGLDPGELLIPEHFALMGAIGAVLSAKKAGTLAEMPDLAAVDQHIAQHEAKAKRLDPLTDDGYFCQITPEPIEGTLPVDAYLGVDVGSISTNVVLLDKNKRVIAREYLMTAGRPINAIQEGLTSIEKQFKDKVRICGVGTTGSGRYLTGDFIGADVIKNEITAHARASAEVNPEVDTILEIGGQDSKFVSLEHGAVVDFTMNKVCAAGTGSFLEEQAERLGVKINREFGDAALAAKSPCDLGDRCTVFVESSLNYYQQIGVAKSDLIAGLCYSIAHNYLNKVVEQRKIGKTIFFQGGTAYNRGVRAAFEKIIGKKIIVPPHHDVMGAIGVALIAMEATKESKQTKFKGFDTSTRKFEVESFECEHCPNSCEIKRVSVEGERPLHYGARCERYDEEKQTTEQAHIPQLFLERKKLLLNSYPKNKPDRPNGKTIGIPQIAHYFELFPLWKGFFTELGYQVVTSRDTNQHIIHKGVGHVAAETCFPIKVAHGHVLDLIDRKVDHIFLPVVVDLEAAEPGFSNSFACPYVQSVPYFIKSAIDMAGTSTLEPILHMNRGRKHISSVLSKLAVQLGSSKAEGLAAAKVAFEALDTFFRSIRARGKEILDGLKPGEMAIGIISRPYNGCDPGMNLNLPEKLREIGAIALPMDFLPLDGAGISKDFPNMYWKYGQRILAAGRYINSHSGLYALYITNFGCGPDSFISKFFEREMASKPYLTIEIDEHSADGGVVTRLEAFLDSLKNVRSKREPAAAVRKAPEYIPIKDKKRVLYVPHMSDHGRLLAAAMRNSGINAEALPIADEESLSIGRKYTSGRECYPCIITTGDIVKKTQAPDFHPDAAAFLMPKAMGPCRFGQYNKFHRMVLDDIGLKQVPVFAMDQERGFDRDLARMGTKLRRMAWQGFVMGDLLQKLSFSIRPYEINKGETDRAYEKSMQLIERTLESGKDISALGHEIRASFDRIPVDRSKKRPRIGVIGEIYVRCNEFANNSIVRKLEALGGEVWLPPFEEWIDYIDHERRETLRVSNDFGGLFKEYVKNWVKEMDLRRISRPFAPTLGRHTYEEHTPQVIGRAKRYLTAAIRGEAVLSMGRADEYLEHGFSGIVNVVPFNCIPGTIVNALLRKFVEDHDNVPCLKLEYDGHEHAGENLRIEAFMHQARQMAERTAEKHQAHATHVASI